ncbi:granulocyte-macrophage colony-stimulating factor receptor subunit alpha-like isoform X2 [Sceloporus undulatus]|uniref:granulocyte-macrophage colony-stimulating factor receptor subunit alpha-like isoform X2 n=1 Tax=Sceloporus undulatus TaxID=8520 RepID=UPI001C4D6C78|nr:granulocyte-macrophage colony-stimulating factor receptor subunit alpha-like isoform X2 [Sceloporus undulatus]
MRRRFLTIIKGKMTTILGCIHIIWLIVLCSILQVAFTQENGTNGTSAENISCIVNSYTFKGSSMNCTWKAGKKAPKDTQYHIYLKHMKEEIECPHYINNNLGRHIGCYFVNMVVSEDKVTLTVNGSSKSIQPLVHKLYPYKHEKPGPPRNITVNCQEQSTYCTVEWKPPPSYINVRESCFWYEIKDETRNRTENIPEGIASKNYSKDARYRLRIRTRPQLRCPLTDAFGEWSEPIEFGTDSILFPTNTLIYAIVGTIIGTLFLVLVCKRSHAWKKLNAPIPQPKDIIKQYDKNMEGLL